MSFVDDFENVLVYVRCINPLHTLDFLLPCYRYGRWHLILEYAQLLSFLLRFHVIPCHVNVSVQSSGCCACTCVYVSFSCFQLSFVSPACLLVSLFANACVRVCVRFRIVNYAGMRSAILAVELVLRNADNAADDTHLASIYRRPGTAGFGQSRSLSRISADRFKNT